MVDLESMVGARMAVRRMLVAGRYRLLDPVGAGGMGRVWLARDEMLDRDVAVKEFVPPDWMTDEEKTRLRDRTLREARSAGRLNHPHVVRVYDVVHWDGLPWIVMEYVPSRSLHQVIKEDGPYTPTTAARIGLAVLDALTAAHRAGVLHRDVKPHNVLIGDDGRVVLTDFGLATFVDDGSVTGPGLVVGSPQYVSPERARDGASTVESDLWSLGATLYAAVEGRSPYARETAMSTLMALATEEPDPPERAGLLTPVLLGLLRHEPSARLTGTEVGRHLRMIISTSSPSPVPGPVTPSVPPRRRATAAGAATTKAATKATTKAAAAGAAVGAAAVGVVKRSVPSQRRAAVDSGPMPPVPPPAAPVPERRASRPVLVAAGVALIVLLGGGGVLAGNLMSHDGDDKTLAAPIASPSPSASPARSPSVSRTPGFAPASCGAIPAGARYTPQPGAPRDLSGLALPSEWSFFTDSSGYHVAVADGWAYWTVGTLRCFRDTAGRRTISFVPTGAPGSDLIAACRVEASRLAASGALPHYQQVQIASAEVDKPAADWNYTYTDTDGTPMEAKTRWEVDRGRAFAVSWTTREVDWTGDSGRLNLMFATNYYAVPAHSGTPSS